MTNLANQLCSVEESAASYRQLADEKTEECLQHVFNLRNMEEKVALAQKVLKTVQLTLEPYNQNKQTAGCRSCFGKDYRKLGAGQT